MKLNKNDPDALPFTDRTMRKFRRNSTSYPPHWLEHPTPAPAPIGKAAWRLAREYGLPDEWRARHRPSIFVLGTVGGGSIFLEECWRFSMVGNSSFRPYPMSTERWPINRHPHTSEMIADPMAELSVEDTWGRTGFRRWDTPKEWFVYEKCGEKPHPSPACSHMRARWPPVEQGSNKWVFMDSSPETLMNPDAANQTYFDLKLIQANPLLRPKFVVPTQVPLYTARYDFAVYYRHRIRPFRNYAAMFKDPEGVRSVPTPEEKAHIEQQDEETLFWEYLDRELGAMSEHPVCKRVIEDPPQFLKDAVDDPSLAYQALKQCLYRMVGDRHERHRLPSFLFINFYGVGLRYWLSLGFEPSQFISIPTEELRWYTPEQVMDFFEEAFPNMRRVKERCEDPRHWDSGSCSGHIAWDKAHFFCDPVESPAAIPRTSWNMTRAMQRHRTGEVSITEIWDISTRMHRATEAYLSSVGVRQYSRHRAFLSKKEQDVVSRAVGEHPAYVQDLAKVERIDDLRNLQKTIKEVDVFDNIVEERQAREQRKGDAAAGG
eukprot:TRINITY_DN7118_c0_g3_i1.p1 TRINITY_DN7118_c0_g3~~TRINITY_DN7118_c0_g3_i1.p1  ORF type:complete len:545 (+),score=131.81 TRINITY_DN7118_c0_g3_i1:616-2250(+)